MSFVKRSPVTPPPSTEPELDWPDLALVVAEELRVEADEIARLYGYKYGVGRLNALAGLLEQRAGIDEPVPYDLPGPEFGGESG